jgi:hypothetical protein
MEGTSSGLKELLSQNIPGGTGENHKQHRWLVSGRSSNRVPSEHTTIPTRLVTKPTAERPCLLLRVPIRAVLL